MDPKIAALCALAVSSSAMGGAPSSSSLDIGVLSSSGTDMHEYEVFLLTGQVFNAMTTPLRKRFARPDTVMGIFDPFGTLVLSNDDGGSTNLPQSQYGSSLSFVAPGSGLYTLRVSGFPDFNFDGFNDFDVGMGHGERGRYAITRSTHFTGLGQTGDFDEGDHITIAGGYGSALGFAELDDEMVHTFTIDLAAGDVLSAMTTPFGDTFSEPDTIMGIFDSGDNLLVANDDAPDGNGSGGLGSSVRFAALIDGTYTIKVTGFPDFNFDGGTHTQVGPYALTVSVVPAPGGAALMALAGLLAGVRRR